MGSLRQISPPSILVLVRQEFTSFSLSVWIELSIFYLIIVLSMYNFFEPVVLPVYMDGIFFQRIIYFPLRLELIVLSQSLPGELTAYWFFKFYGIITLHVSSTKYILQGLTYYIVTAFSKPSWAFFSYFVNMSLNCFLLVQFFFIVDSYVLMKASVWYFQTCPMCSPLSVETSISLITPVTLVGKSRQTLFTNFSCLFERA